MQDGYLNGKFDVYTDSMALSPLYAYDNYRYDVAILKKYGTSYKFCKINTVREKGLENAFEYGGKGSTNDEKLQNNIIRARSKLFEYVMCNDFQFFVTFTLNKEKYNRYDLDKFKKDFSKFLNHYNERKNANIKYIVIPEQHSDGAWHMHGFIKGLPLDRLTLFELHGDKPLSKYIVDKLKNNQLLYYWSDYEKKFGYNLFELIRNKKASVLYMSKYLTKDISKNVKELGGHLYYCSKGLNKAEVIKEGSLLDSEFDFDYANEFCSTKFFDVLSDEELQALKSIITQPLTLQDLRNGYMKCNGFKSFVDVATGEILSDKYKKVEELFDEKR